MKKPLVFTFFVYLFIVSISSVFGAEPGTHIYPSPCSVSLPVITLCKQNDSARIQRHSWRNIGPYAPEVENVWLDNEVEQGYTKVVVSTHGISVQCGYNYIVIDAHEPGIVTMIFNVGD